MNQVRLDPGIYVNVFPIEMNQGSIQVMVASRKSFSDLRPLRKKVSDSGWFIHFAANGHNVYGYGPDMCQLEDIGFHPESIQPTEKPQIAIRLITDGIIDAAVENGFQPKFGKGRIILIQNKPREILADGNIHIHMGYDLRGIYWRMDAEDDLILGLVIDVTWAFKDETGNSLNMHQIAQYNAVTKVAQIQGDYLPGGSRINTEVSRQRLQEQIMPFVQAYKEFSLPCGGKAKLISEPVRVILGGR